jgi:hypothetical protein
MKRTPREREEAIRCLEYAEGNMRFAQWLFAVALPVLEQFNVSVTEFEDFGWRDTYESGAPVDEAFEDFVNWLGGD